MIKIFIWSLLLIATTQGIFRSSALNKPASSPSDNALSNHRTPSGSSTNNHPPNKRSLSNNKRGSWVAEVTAGRNMLAKATASANKFSNGNNTPSTPSAQAANNNQGSIQANAQVNQPAPPPPPPLPPTTTTNVGTTIPVTSVTPNANHQPTPSYQIPLQQQIAPTSAAKESALQQMVINPNDQQQPAQYQLQQPDNGQQANFQHVNFNGLNMDQQKTQQMQHQFNQLPHQATPQMQMPQMMMTPQQTPHMSQIYTPQQQQQTFAQNLQQMPQPPSNMIPTHQSMQHGNLPTPQQQMHPSQQQMMNLQNQLIQSPSAQTVPQQNPLIGHQQTNQMMPNSSMNPNMNQLLPQTGQVMYTQADMGQSYPQTPSGFYSLANNGPEKWTQTAAGAQQAPAQNGYNDFNSPQGNSQQAPPSQQQQQQQQQQTQQHPNFQQQQSVQTPGIYPQQHQQQHQPQQPHHVQNMNSNQGQHSPQNFQQTPMVQPIYVPQQAQQPMHAQGPQMMNPAMQQGLHMAGGSMMGNGHRIMNFNGAPQEKVPGEALRLLQGAVSFSFSKRQGNDYGFLPGEPLWSRVEGSSDLLPPGPSTSSSPPTNTNSNPGSNNQPSNQNQGPRNFNNYNCLHFEFDNREVFGSILAQSFSLTSSLDKWSYHVPRELLNWNILVERIMKQIERFTNVITATSRSNWWSNLFVLPPREEDKKEL